MKVTHRIPTTQYGYVEVETAEGLYKDAAEIREHHDIILAAFKEKPESTLPEKEFSELVYSTLHHTMDMKVDVWEQCNPAQKNFLKLLKNAMNRKKPQLPTDYDSKDY